MRKLGLILAVAAVLVLPAAAQPLAAPAGHDWTRFGYDAARHGVGPANTGITAANVGKLVRKQVQVGGTIDSSPIYLHAVSVFGSKHNVFFITTRPREKFSDEASFSCVGSRVSEVAHSTFPSEMRSLRTKPSGAAA